MSRHSFLNIQHAGPTWDLDHQGQYLFCFCLIRLIVVETGAWYISKPLPDKYGLHVNLLHGIIFLWQFFTQFENTFIVEKAWLINEGRIMETLELKRRCKESR